MRVVLVATVLLAVVVLGQQFYGEQTDWSDGGGVYGPVWEWDTEFYSSSGTNYAENPGFLYLSGVSMNYIHETDSGCYGIAAADIDGDSYIDITGLFFADNSLSWWRNMEHSGMGWMRLEIDTQFDPSFISFCELSGDSSIDLLSYSNETDEFMWLENPGGTGYNWERHIIRDSCYVPMSEAVDVDSDGDLDLLAEVDYSLTCFVNEDGSGDSWTEYPMDDTLGIYRWSCCSDLDSDGDSDLAAICSSTDEINWFENEGGGLSWTKHTIESNYSDGSDIHSGDINGDGFPDLVCTATFSNELTWWENSDTSPGSYWTKVQISDQMSGVYSSGISDLDNDGDLDVLSIPIRSPGSVYISWWENIDGSGMLWLENDLSQFFQDADEVCPVDLDCDGVIDVAVADYHKGLAWLKRSEYEQAGILESTVLEIGWPTRNHIIWGPITWRGSQPDSTMVAFQVRSFQDTSSMGPWSDTIYTSGTSLEGILGMYDLYLQYRLMMATESPFRTPVVDQVHIDWDITSIADVGNDEELGLMENMTNPCRGDPIVVFSLPDNRAVRIRVYDVSGRVLDGVSREYSEGEHSVGFFDLPPGVYFIRMDAGDLSDSEQIVVIP